MCWYFCNALFWKTSRLKRRFWFLYNILIWKSKKRKYIFKHFYFEKLSDKDSDFFILKNFQINFVILSIFLFIKIVDKIDSYFFNNIFMLICKTLN